MSVELKPGYWKTDDGTTVEIFCDRDDRWFGRVVGDHEAPGHSWLKGELGQHGGLRPREYVGPTLPPDPGLGWRLLDRSEDYFGSDEFYDPLTGTWRRVAGSDDYIGVRHKQWGADFWYRRRVTPVPPTPPEGWELLPDGTPGDMAFMANYGDGWNMAHPNGVLWPSGQLPSGGFLWYARRIEPEPQWERTNEIRYVRVPETYKGSPVLYALCDNGYGSYRLKLQQRWTCGDQSEWRDVVVSQ